MDTASKFNKSLGDKYQPEKPTEYQLQHTGYDQSPPPGYDPGQAGYNQPPPPGYDAEQAGYNQPPPPGYDAEQACYNQPPPPGYVPRQAGYNQSPPPDYDPRQAGYNQPPPSDYGSPQAGSGESTIVMVQPTSVMCIVPLDRPPDYLILSIFAIFLCWPIAICAIYFSSSSRDAFKVGDIEKAKRYGQCARNIVIAAILSDILIIAIVVGIQMTSRKLTMDNTTNFES